MIYQIRQEQPPEEKAASAGDGNLRTPMRLRDFLVGVATIYDLPDRFGKPIPAPHPLKKRERQAIPKWRKNLLLAAAAVTSILWAAATIQKRPEQFGMLPEAMNGGWHTADPRYRNRAFWIKGNRIAFQTGGDSLEVTYHQVTQVDQKILAGDTLQYTVQYLVDGTPTTWAVQFVEQPKPAIRFLNQREMIWTPLPGSPWPGQ